MAAKNAQFDDVDSDVNWPRMMIPAWVATIALAGLLHSMIAAGGAIENPQVQCVLLFAISTSGVALLGTAHLMQKLREQGRTIALFLFSTVFLLACAAIVSYGLRQF